MKDLYFLQPLLFELQVAKEKALVCDEGQYQSAGSHFGGAKYNNTYYVYCLSDYEPANCNRKIKLPGWENIRPAKEISIIEQIEIRDKYRKMHRGVQFSTGRMCTSLAKSVL